MKYAITFSLLGLLCVFYCAAVESPVARLLLSSLALCWLGVGLAYAGIGGRVFGKRRDGKLQAWSALFWPFHLLNFALLRAFRQSKRENSFDEIHKNLWLGCQLDARDKTQLKQHGVASVLDLTCEFAEPAFLRALNYRSIPVLDTRAPTLTQLREGADFIAHSIEEGAVYVHCALGHGRSALFVAAYLLQSGRAQNADEAIELVRQKRANIELHPEQRALLRRFEAQEERIKP